MVGFHILQVLLSQVSDWLGQDFDFYDRCLGYEDEEAFSPIEPEVSGGDIDHGVVGYAGAGGLDYDLGGLGGIVGFVARHVGRGYSC